MIGHAVALDALGLALEACHGLLEGTLAKFLTLYSLKLLGSEWNLHGRDLEEVLLGALVVVVVDDIEHAVPDDVGDVHTDTLAHQGVAALLVDHGTLLVHHVVVLREVLTDTEVVLLHLALCTLDALADHWTLDTLAVLEAQAVHHLGNTLRGEETHQFVFQRYIEDRRAGSP